MMLGRRIAMAVFSSVEMSAAPTNHAAPSNGGGFQTRADAMFAALDAAKPGQQDSNSSWQLSKTQVFRPGKEAGDSSDDEAPAPTAEAGLQEYLPGSLVDLEGTDIVAEDGTIMQPSAAFCRALDDEGEYDAADAVAGQTLHTAGGVDLKPHRQTEVLDDNIWEQRAQSHQQASSSRPDLPADMETDAVLPAPRSQQPQRTLEAAAHSQQLLSAPAEFVSGHIMEAPSDRRAVAPAEQPSKQARFSAPTQRSPRPSKVPDHVKNPSRYTCYVLDEPITVGSGNRQTGVEQAELEQAARSAMSAAQAQQQAQMAVDESALEVPAFGEGIEFRPRAKPRSSEQHSRQPGSRPLSITTAEDDSLEAEGESPIAKTAAPPRRRQMRARVTSEEV